MAARTRLTPSRPRRRPATARRGPAQRRPRTSHGQDSRQAILDAATGEFAAVGYDAATVDRIAARARLNKAMIYYHFRSKRRLYAVILRAWFDRLFRRIETIAASDDPPDRQIATFIEAVVREGEAQPALPRMMAREIADGGRHLDPATVRTMARIPRTVAGVIERGRRAGRFVEIDPFLAYLIMLGPMIFYLVSGPVRETIARYDVPDAARLRSDTFIADLQLFVRRGLGAPVSTGPTGDRP